jgi:aromatic-amino-acid transaminase
MAPGDPILGITEAYNRDTSPDKVNLGVGVYYDERGQVPLLECVRKAEALLAQDATPRSYIPIDGMAAYCNAVQGLILGTDSPVIKNRRVITTQGVGGTGALKVGADFLKRFLPNAQVWISNPSWENHRALFESAGFVVNEYPYYDEATFSVNFNGLIESLQSIPHGSIVVLHACCHNPTGADLSTEQWGEVIRVVAERGLMPFLDMAYQGFGQDLEADGKVVHLFAETGITVFVSSTFSKSFSLYSERIGALSIIASSTEEAARVLSQIKRLIRTNYSSPPTHGAKLVTAILNKPELRALWKDELSQMRSRIKDMRHLLAHKLKERSPAHDFAFITKQSGLFSYSGLTKAQVARLRDAYSIYMLDTGRICVAAINTNNIDHVANAIAEVL